MPFKLNVSENTAVTNIKQTPTQMLMYLLPSGFVRRDRTEFIRYKYCAKLWESSVPAFCAFLFFLKYMEDEI